VLAAQAELNERMKALEGANDPKVKRSGGKLNAAQEYFTGKGDIRYRESAQDRKFRERVNAEKAARGEPPMPTEAPPKTYGQKAYFGVRSAGRATLDWLFGEKEEEEPGMGE
jgi:hypothetical protein